MPRRGAAAPRTPGNGDPRRAVPVEGNDPTAPWFQRRGWWAAGAVTLVVLIPVLWFVLLSTPGGQPVSPPSPLPSTTASPSAEASGAVAATTSPPAVAPPLPGTASPGPVINAPVEPAPSGGSTVGLIELNDARFTIPDGWTLYGDEVIEGDRRAVRLSNAATDARLQAVTLVPGTTALEASCTSLVDLQQTQFAEVSRQLVVPIGVDDSLGSGVRCGFSGIRSADGVPTTVTFTLVSRISDAHVLMLRSTTPDAAANNTDMMLQLASMSCEASASFGVPQPLC